MKHAYLVIPHQSRLGKPLTVVSVEVSTDALMENENRELLHTKLGAMPRTEMSTVRGRMSKHLEAFEWLLIR